jgi:hypothetical protein
MVGLACPCLAFPFSLVFTYSLTISDFLSLLILPFFANPPVTHGYFAGEYNH